MAYVVQDFIYHLFLRDHYAIKMNDGISWNRLKDDGILDIQKIQQL